MPRRGPTKDSPITIDLSNPKAYLPGDAILGTVTVSSKHRQPIKFIQLTLGGRAKVKVIKKSGHFHTTSRSAGVFFETTQKLTSDSANVPNADDGAAVWTFEFELPSSPTRTKAGNQFPRHTDFPSNQNDGDIANTTLPTIFYWKKEGSSGVIREAYVEYWLEALSATEKAVHPLFVRCPSTKHPVQDFDLSTKTLSLEAKSYRLRPEFADSKLSFSQRNRERFNSSEVPRYPCQIHLHVPRVYQMDHPEPMPMFLWSTPVQGEQVSSVYDGGISSLPLIQLLAVRAQLNSKCRTRANVVYDDPKRAVSSTYNIGFFAPKEAPLLIPSVLESPSEDPPDSALPLGQVVLARISNDRDSVSGRSVPPAGNRINCSFTTYNIAVTHDLQIELLIQCGGKTDKLVYNTPLKLLSPSEEQVQSKEQELGEEGMRKSYDELKATLETSAPWVGAATSIVSIIAG